MASTYKGAHPYIPNSAAEARARALRAIGVRSVADLYDTIPDRFKLAAGLDLPAPHLSERALRRHVEGLLGRNRDCASNLSFLGAGCYQHYVPAVCDEIAARGEFLTAYVGDAITDLGRYQALFESQSMLGDLVGMDVVSTPTYDGTAAAGTCLGIACRVTGRNQVLLPAALDPARSAQLSNFLRGTSTIVTYGYDPETGLADVADIERKLGPDTAAVYVENPSYFGAIEAGAARIAALAHARGALSVVYVDPISLGVLAAPADYGADLVAGDLQPLGIHMLGGGGCGGWFACRDEERFVAEIASILISISREADGTFSYGWSTFERTSYEKRGQSADYTGTTQWHWGLVAGVYLALMGPRGMAEIGKGILERVRYAVKRLAAIPGVVCPRLAGAPFKEFLVNFDDTGKSVAEINARLRERGIFGGKDLSREFPEVGQSALYCVTEIHSRADLDELARSLEEVVR